MSSVQTSNGGFGAGFAAATLATIVWYLVVAYGTSLTNGGLLLGLAVGSGALLAAGAAMTFRTRTRRFGLGLAAGAPIAAFVVVGAFVALLVLVVGS